jgi:integrase
MPKARRKKQKSDYVGCSITSHHGRLRLEWRTEQGRATWSTGDKDTPEMRERWEKPRRLVAALRNQGEDPLPHLARLRAPANPDAPPAPTIRSYFPEWIQTKHNKRPALQRDYRRHIQRYVLGDLIADIPLAEMRPGDMKLFQGRLSERRSIYSGKPLSEKTVRCVIGGSLRALIRDARVEDYLQRDPFVGLEWEQWDIPEAQPLDSEDWSRVAAWFNGRQFQRKLVWKEHPAFFAYVFFLRWHGARPSEAAALTWDNVNLRKGVAEIVASYSYRAVCKTKTRAARRIIELHPEMLTLLKALRPLRPEPGQLVFPNKDGHPITAKGFHETWTRCLQDCRIPHRGIYCLKDTFVSHTLKMAEETGEVERLTAWLIRQTGVRLDTLKLHYAKFWPRDRDAIHATYALLDPRLGANCHPIATQRTKNAVNA